MQTDSKLLLSKPSLGGSPKTTRWNVGEPCVRVGPSVSPQEHRLPGPPCVGTDASLFMEGPPPPWLSAGSQVRICSRFH